MVIVVVVKEEAVCLVKVQEGKKIYNFSVIPEALRRVGKRDFGMGGGRSATLNIMVNRSVLVKVQGVALPVHGRCLLMIIPVGLSKLCGGCFLISTTRTK